MRFGYCDESGIGEEPIAVMVGIIVDATRMHLTKVDWQELLEDLSGLTGRTIRELHATDFYRGNGPWRSVSGRTRARIISAIFDWLEARRHTVVYSTVVKEQYFESLGAGQIPDELSTPWRFMGFHLILAVQRAHQGLARNKGNTVFVFDNEERERLRFTDIIMRPPSWSDEYYGRNHRDRALNQVIDVPFFVDSQDVGLIQLADVFAFFLRRYLELDAGLKPKYADEPQRVSKWVECFARRSIGRQHIYPVRARSWAADLFFQHAPEAARAI